MSKTQRYIPEFAKRKRYKKAILSGTGKRCFNSLREQLARDRWLRGFDKHWPSHFGGKDDYWLEGHMNHRDRLKPEMPRKEEL